jgi:hypothetical protein
VLAHYGASHWRAAWAIRIAKAKSKLGSATRRKTPLRGQRFEPQEQAQAYLDHWEQRWADTRIHGTTKRQVAATFAEEKLALLPLPLEPFRYYQYGTRAIDLISCLLSDELTRRSDRLLERRRKQAGFRDPNKTPGQLRLHLQSENQPTSSSIWPPAAF